MTHTHPCAGGQAWAQTGTGLVLVWKHTSLSTHDVVFTLLFLDMPTHLAAPLPVNTHACLFLFFFFFLYIHIYNPPASMSSSPCLSVLTPANSHLTMPGHTCCGCPCLPASTMSLMSSCFSFYFIFVFTSPICPCLCPCVHPHVCIPVPMPVCAHASDLHPIMPGHTCCGHPCLPASAMSLVIMDNNTWPLSRQGVSNSSLR